MANEAYVNLMKKIWTDDEFKKKFKADPRGMSEKEGIEVKVPELEVVEQSPEKLYFVIYPPPEDIEAWGKEQMAMAERGKCNGMEGCRMHAQICK
ncbi:MAG: hypothetical protein GTO45_21485 [Candidatus Aminicenantes bacterium]|nr:hypothetical protein [Candidatus Aminicenantes bacterium]NIM81329.1 hypothetical protein [Candidatus Aminicenantes bacterium]NIN20739.1 hypothetical protein [Candidatus Aminicenantes bacterium]NIN44517.1 hypothetical protein [Candidatus Aminicenantes bacterium]NIN87337.1 hypothetical protein [Candidatus Aminicenantes bacterium]